MQNDGTDTILREMHLGKYVWPITIFILFGSCLTWTRIVWEETERPHIDNMEVQYVRVNIIDSSHEFVRLIVYNNTKHRDLASS